MASDDEHGSEGGPDRGRPRGIPGPDDNGGHLRSFAPLPPDVKREHLLGHGEDAIALRELTPDELDALHDAQHAEHQPDGPDAGGQEAAADQ